MHIEGLDYVPGATIQVWLKNKRLPHSGNTPKRIEQLLAEKKLSEADLVDLVIDHNFNGRKHVRIFRLTTADWEKMLSPVEICKRWESTIKDDNNILNALGMSLDKIKIHENKVFIRVCKIISVPYVDEDTCIKQNGIEFVARRYKDAQIGIVFVADFTTNTAEIRYDSLYEIGREKKAIFQQGEKVLIEWLHPEDLNRLSLMKLAENIDTSELASISDIIAKYETENTKGDLVSGTVRYSREGVGNVSATELPGGENLLDSKSDDHYLDKYSVLWSSDASGDILTRDIRTEILTQDGEIYFASHVLMNEMNYVLSRIKKLA